MSYEVFRRYFLWYYNRPNFTEKPECNLEDMLESIYHNLVSLMEDVYADAQRTYRDERKAKRTVFGKWKIIVSTLFYYKMDRERNATGEVKKRFLDLKRTHDSFEAARIATEGDLSVNLVPITREHAIRIIESCFVRNLRLPKRDKKHPSRLKRIDRLFRELKDL